MIKNILTNILIAVVITIMASCQSETTKDKNATEVTSNDSVVATNTKPAESGYADVNGLKLYYEVYGKGKPLVLLHGSLMSTPAWAHIIPMIANNRQVIVPEMQGHGRTRDIPREMSYEGMADDVSGLLKHLNIDSADILGWSMGGGVAFQFAVRHPEQLRRLVVVSAPYAHDGWLPETEASFATFNADMFKGTTLKKQYDSLGNDPAHFPEFVKKVMSVDLKPYDWSKEVKAIKAPIFLAIGDADGVRYEHALELYRAKGGGKQGDLTGTPQSRLAILPGSTHIAMFMQRQNWLIPMITDFLDSDLNEKPPTF